jgi:hypothetical protein
MIAFRHDGHACRAPESSDFRDGQKAEGCWRDRIADGRDCHCQQIVGESGIYMRIVDMATGEVLRDDTPWQMTI